MRIPKKHLKLWLGGGVPSLKTLVTHSSLEVDYKRRIPVTWPSRPICRSSINQTWPWWTKNTNKKVSMCIYRVSLSFVECFWLFPFCPVLVPIRISRIWCSCMSMSHAQDPLVAQTAWNIAVSLNLLGILLVTLFGRQDDQDDHMIESWIAWYTWNALTWSIFLVQFYFLVFTLFLSGSLGKTLADCPTKTKPKKQIPQNLSNQRSTDKVGQPIISEPEPKKC